MRLLNDKEYKAVLNFQFVQILYSFIKIIGIMIFGIILFSLEGSNLLSEFSKFSVLFLFWFIIYSFPFIKNIIYIINHKELYGDFYTISDKIKENNLYFFIVNKDGLEDKIDVKNFLYKIYEKEDTLIIISGLNNLNLTKDIIVCLKNK